MIVIHVSPKIWKERHHFAICGAAFLILLPALLGPPMLRDSFWISWVWSDQFTAELAKGNLYPRWLPDANGGAGSPTFYFYPPLSFYVSGLIGLLIPTYWSIVACFGVALTLSGYTMLAWLRDTKRPLLGAILFMAAPYHVLDFYSRGAQAEFLAISLLPLVALGLRRAGEGRRVLLAFAYAALILAHLPLALLTSVFLIAPYCLWRRQVRACAPSLVTGMAIAAIYLVPALALNAYRHSELLWADPQYHAKNWSLIFPHEGPVWGMRKVFAAVLLGSFIPIGVLWVARQRIEAGYASACCIIAAGVVPAIWALPLLREVQFPFRMLPLIEFAIATGIASAPLTRRMLQIAALPTVILSPVFVLVHQQENVPTMEHLKSFHPDTPENQLRRAGPLPDWPERVGLMISLSGLLAAAGMHFQIRRLKKP